tara:strand:+ start:169 stop:480 length:312 start_codon:yes stop_codon:yes gene_type:complete
MEYSFITDEIIKTLKDNHANADWSTKSIADDLVVVKYFNPFGAGNWWVYSMDEHNRMFGIADIFEPEYGYFMMQDLKDNDIERDLYYTPKTFNQVMQKQKEVR